MNAEHSHDVATPHAPFTEAEINTFHADDRKEATIVVSLIASIFFTGVVIYSLVVYGILS